MQAKWYITLYPKANGWYNGANIPGKKIEPLNYTGGTYCPGRNLCLRQVSIMSNTTRYGALPQALERQFGEQLPRMECIEGERLT